MPDWGDARNTTAANVVDVVDVVYVLHVLLLARRMYDGRQEEYPIRLENITGFINHSCMIASAPAVSCIMYHLSQTYHRIITYRVRRYGIYQDYHSVTLHLCFVVDVIETSSQYKINPIDASKSFCFLISACETDILELE